MKTGKFALLTAFSVVMAFTLSSCAGLLAPQQAFLSKGVPENFFSDSKIDIDDSKKVSYKFKSELDDPFVHYNGHIDLNASYKSVLKNYMNYKYTLVSNKEGGGDYQVDVVLEDCTSEAVHAGTQTVSAHGSGGYAVSSVQYVKVTTEMTVKVRVNINGEVSEKEIIGMGEFTGMSTDWNTVTRSFDIAIRATISRMDRFLSSTIGAAK